MYCVISYNVELTTKLILREGATPNVWDISADVTEGNLNLSVFCVQHTLLASLATITERDIA